MDFNIQVVYEAGPRFKKLTSRLNIGKSVFISGLFDLNENENPFILAKEIDLLDDSSINISTNQPNINLQSPFSLTNKFKTNKYTIQNPPTTNTETIKDNEPYQNIIIKKEDEPITPYTSTSDANTQQFHEKPKKINKRKKESDNPSVQQLKKSVKKTKIKTRSQKEESTSEQEST